MARQASSNFSHHVGTQATNQKAENDENYHKGRNYCDSTFYG